MKWIEEDHDVHIIYVTDNRAWLEWGIKERDLDAFAAEPFQNLSGNEMAEICLKEARDVVKGLGLLPENGHYFKIHDQDARNNIELGINLSKELIKDASRIVLCSDNNSHVDHQATHTIAKEAAKALNLWHAEFYVYALYDMLKIPKEKQVKISVVEYREKKYEILKLYKTQLALKTMQLGWENFKRKRVERFGLFNLEDAGKYPNF